MSQAPEVTPLVLITAKWMESTFLYWVKAEYESGYQAALAAIHLADKHGVHVWDDMVCALGGYGAIVRGDRQSAREFLDRMKTTLSPERRQGYGQYHLVAAWYHAVFGDLAVARSHAQAAVRWVVEIRGSGDTYFPESLCRIALTNVLCSLGDFDEAALQFAAAQEAPGRNDSPMLVFMREVAAARIAFGRKEEVEGLSVLHRALAAARANDIVSMVWWWEPGVMAGLCQKALDAGIEVEHTRKIVRTHNLQPDVSRPSANWPWPIRIRALGRFEVQRDGQPLEVSARAQQKPLALLKALVAFGSRNVPENRLADALWHDAEGDRARNSLRVTSFRLREMLGCDDVLIVAQGSYTLDASRVWVDVGDFENALARIETQLNDGRQEEALTTANRIVALYRGPFLEAESEPWAISARERLRGRFVRLLAQTAEAVGAHDPAAVIPLYEKAIEVDPLAEALYQGLMESHRVLGRAAEGLSVYRRCRDVLARELSIPPSVATEALRQALQRR